MSNDIESTLDVKTSTHILMEEQEILILLQCRNVFRSPSRKIVDTDNMISARKQR